MVLDIRKPPRVYGGTASVEWAAGPTSHTARRMERYFHLFSYTAGLAVSVTLYLMVRPALTAAGRATHMQWLLAIHMFRYFGFTALLPGVFDLERAGFSRPYLMQVAWGDVGACVMAIALIHVWRRRLAWATAATWVFSVYGILDYLNAAATITPKIKDPNLIGPFGWYIFTVFLPAWLVTHGAIVLLLVRRDADIPAEHARATLGRG
jgi:hypothetical protein